MKTSDIFEIRARFDETTIRVYQAYSASIAAPSLAAGKFVAPLKFSRMTWIKPSFNWMMYRSGFASKSGQEFVLAIDITREGFEWALQNAAFSSYRPRFHSSYEAWQREVESKPVRIQWDPERDWKLQPIPGVRAIQIGLSAGEAVQRYVNEWIIRIEDVTPLAHLAAKAAASGSQPTPPVSNAEHVYPLNSALVATICRD